MGTDGSNIIWTGPGPGPADTTPAPRVIYDGPKEKPIERRRVVVCGPAGNRVVVCERWAGVDAMNADKWETVTLSEATRRANILEAALLALADAK